MDYKIEIKKTITTEGEKWIAICPALQGVRGGGNTPEEALSVLKTEMEYMLDFLKDEGEELPEPDALSSLEGYSGRITYRPGKKLHQNITEQAKKHDVSINSYINNAVSFYLGSNSYLNQASSLEKIMQQFIEEIKDCKK